MRNQYKSPRPRQSLRIDLQRVASLRQAVVQRLARIRLPGLRSTLAALAIIVLLSSLGLFQAFDEVCYDAMVALAPASRSGDQQVLLVEADPDAPEDWRQVADHLFAAGAEKVGFQLALDAATLEALAASPQADRIYIGLPMVERDDLPGGYRTRPSPASIPSPLRVAVLSLPDQGGIVREQRLAAMELPEPLATLEAAMAGRTGPAAGLFRVNFHGGVELPRLPATQVAAAPPIRQLTAGRLALVGYARAPYHVALRIPGTAATRTVSQLEFHGLALDTLLRDRPVRSPPIPVTLAALLALGLAAYLLLMPLPPQIGLTAGGGLLLAQAAATMAMLVAFDYWLPLVEGTLVNLTVLIMVFRARLVREDQRLQRLAQTTTGKLHRRVVPPNFAETDDHWAQVINLVDQLLHLRRTLFLDRVPGDHRVKEIQALRCSIADISEMRRDYHRFPYTAAIERRGMIEIGADRPFLRMAEVPERQYLVPLIFAGEILGFWTFGILPEKVGDESRFAATVEQLAGQIGALLYQRKVWQDRQVVEQSAWSRYLSDTLSISVTRLTQSVTALEARLTGFEQLFAGLATAAILYDLFGRVILINDKMATLLAAWKLAPYDLRAVDLVCALTGRPADATRDAVRSLVFEGQELLFEVSPADDRRQHFLMHMRALKSAEDGAAPAVGGHGILLEMMDIAEAHRELRTKADALHFVFDRVGEHLAVLEAGVGDLPAPVRQHLDGVARWIGRVDDLVRREMDAPQESQASAINPVPYLHRLAAGLTRDPQPADVRLVEPLPACLVFANPGEFERLLRAALRLLADDALSDTAIEIALGARDPEIHLELSNQGFGLPPERLAALLAPPSEATQEPWLSLNRGRGLVAQWGGRLEIATSLGSGFRVTLTLRGFA